MTNEEKYKKFMDELERKLSPEEEAVSNRIYESVRRQGGVSDMELAMFMSDKLDNITRIMHASDELLSRDGHISRIERKTVVEKNEHDNSETVRKEIDDLKGEIRELKQLLINKLS